MDGEGFQPFWFFPTVYLCYFIEWMEKDSNLRRRCQQIYSLPPLATRESIHIQEQTIFALDNIEL